MDILIILTGAIWLGAMGLACIGMFMTNTWSNETDAKMWRFWKILFATACVLFIMAYATVSPILLVVALGYICIGACFLVLGPLFETIPEAFRRALLWPIIVRDWYLS